MENITTMQRLYSANVEITNICLSKGKVEFQIT